MIPKRTVRFGGLLGQFDCSSSNGLKMGFKLWLVNYGEIYHIHSYHFLFRWLDCSLVFSYIFFRSESEWYRCPKNTTLIPFGWIGKVRLTEFSSVWVDLGLKNDLDMSFFFNDLSIH